MHPFGSLIDRAQPSVEADVLMRVQGHPCVQNILSWSVPPFVATDDLTLTNHLPCRRCLPTQPGCQVVVSSFLREDDIDPSDTEAVRQYMHDVLSVRCAPLGIVPSRVACRLYVN